MKTGDWTCMCGQAYRVAVADGDVRMWPKSSAYGYRREPIGSLCACGASIARGPIVSALFGADIQPAT